MAKELNSGGPAPCLFILDAFKISTRNEPRNDSHEVHLRF